MLWITDPIDGHAILMNIPKTQLSSVRAEPVAAP
jgi:hypothetical protein